MGRLTAGLFRDDEVSLQTYVDDPCVIATGSDAEINLSFATIICAWRCLGFPLSFRKAMRGLKIVWIGCTLEMLTRSVVASIKEESLSDILARVTGLLKSNVCSRKEIASLAGKANHVATLVWTWRPFLQALWASIHAPCPGAPAGCIWTVQVRSSLLWLKAFLSRQAGTLTRTFICRPVHLKRIEIGISVDASPWGLGGILTRGPRVMEWFAVGISPVDVCVLGLPIGTSEGQQAWECLAALYAMRLWAPQWQHDKLALHLKGDSVAMLSLVLKMQPPSHSKSLGILAREIALDMSEAVFEPHVLSHVPGVANCIPDSLSRRFMPKYAHTWVCPAVLSAAVEARELDRTISFYRTVQAKMD